MALGVKAAGLELLAWLGAPGPAAPSTESAAT